MFEYQRVSLRDLEGIHGATSTSRATTEASHTAVGCFMVSRHLRWAQRERSCLQSHYIILYTPSHLPLNLLHQSINIVTTNLYQFNYVFTFPMPPRPVPRLCHFFSSPRLLPGLLEGHCGANCPEILKTTALRGAVNSNSEQCFLGRIRI